MASVRSTRLHLFAWCPLGRHDPSEMQRHEAASRAAHPPITDARPQQRHDADEMVVVDIRQAGPWQQASHREATARTPASLIDRLSR